MKNRLYAAPRAARITLIALALAASAAAAETYSRSVVLAGSAQPSEQISGVRGQAITLGSEKSNHAVYGLFSVERRDNPCYLAVRAESVNDSNDNSGEIRNLCGDKGTSSELGVAFENGSSHGRRVFMTGIRVCLNNDRVKGLQIRGKRITEDGQLVELVGGSSSSGEQRFTTITEPRDDRTNCRDDGWRRWVECPQSNQIVTAIVAHFERGDTPRSLTGIGLQCRQVAIQVAARP